MEAILGPLLPLYERERAARRSLALGVLIHAAGSTYRKPGALLLIAGSGEYAGLISGGCLEGDLREHASAVLRSGAARVLRYDSQDDDPLWGMGLGCEGAMHVLLLRVGAENDWQPLAHLVAARAAHLPTAFGAVVESGRGDLPVGTIALPEGSGLCGAAAPLPPEAFATAVKRAIAGGPCWLESPGLRVVVVPLALPPRILLLGAGPDAIPIVEFAVRLDWKVTLADHRPALACAAQFPGAERVVCARPEELPGVLALDGFSAAVVMNHHLPTDLEHLRLLARTAIPYVGLLGPARRRERLMLELGVEAKALENRLHAPVGLRLGGRTPEAIALAIVAEIHSNLFNRL